MLSFPDDFFFLKLRCRAIQLLPRDVSRCEADLARSGSLLHLSFDRMNVFLKKYFLLRMYLDMASAHARRPQNRAQSSAQRPRPWSWRFGFAPVKAENQSHHYHHRSCGSVSMFCKHFVDIIYVQCIMLWLS